MQYMPAREMIGHMDIWPGGSVERNMHMQRTYPTMRRAINKGAQGRHKGDTLYPAAGQTRFPWDADGTM